MIDPHDSSSRARLARSVKHWHTEMERYRLSRKETVLMHAGSPQMLSSLGVTTGKRPWGNLMQMAARAHTISLSYGDPQFLAVPETPDVEDDAEQLEMLLNRYSDLIDLGETARSVALDSFFGYGVFYIGKGVLPPMVRHATGQNVGTIVERLSTDKFLFDGSVTRWEDCAYFGHTYTVPLAEARTFEPFVAYNPQGAAELQEFTQQGSEVGSKLHDTPSSMTTPEAMTQLVDLFIPRGKRSDGTVGPILATWPANNISFAGIEGDPLWVRDYTGHASVGGSYVILNHLDIPDNLIPTAQSESVKELHLLFNDLADRTAAQARDAKFHPVYEIGANKDIERLNAAQDRAPVGVSNINKIGSWEKPGPSQSQTAAMHGALHMFKEFAGNLDDTLGLAPTAKTARQSQLIRESTTILGAEARRRMNRCMELVARKMGHYLINDPSLRLTMRRPVGGPYAATIRWQPLPLEQQRSIDDFSVRLEPFSMEYRAPESRLAQLNEAAGQLFQAAQMHAAGIPINLPEVIETQVKYRNLPELRDWLIDLLPEHKQQTQQAASVPDPNKGHYVRENVSEQSNAGSLTQMLTQMTPDDGGRGGVQVGG